MTLIGQGVHRRKQPRASSGIKEYIDRLDVLVRHGVQVHL
jgi:hypothetical protein